jgi:hypothetical protein
MTQILLYVKLDMIIKLIWAFWSGFQAAFERLSSDFWVDMTDRYSFKGCCSIVESTNFAGGPTANSMVRRLDPHMPMAPWQINNGMTVKA